MDDDLLGLGIGHRASGMLNFISAHLLGIAILFELQTRAVLM